MKTTLITAALIISSALLTAQTEKKQATVRLKKVENINGVEKVTDTTYTTDDVSVIDAEGQNIEITEIGNDKEGEMKRIVIIKDEDAANTSMHHNKKILDEEITKALKEAGVDPNSNDFKKVIIVNEESSPSGENKEAKKMTKSVALIKMNITDPNQSELKRVSQQIGTTDGKLILNNMNFYPNPNNGKFNLNFSLNEKGDTEITILNVEGKKIYNEKLSSFSGTYDKEIDISKNPKGIYFVRIEQGKHSQVKKIVMD